MEPTGSSEAMDSTAKVNNSPCPPCPSADASTYQDEDRFCGRQQESPSQANGISCDDDSSEGLTSIAETAESCRAIYSSLALADNPVDGSPAPLCPTPISEDHDFLDPVTDRVEAWSRNRKKRAPISRTHGAVPLDSCSSCDNLRSQLAKLRAEHEADKKYFHGQLSIFQNEKQKLKNDAVARESTLATLNRGDTYTANQLFYQRHQISVLESAISKKDQLFDFFLVNTSVQVWPQLEDFAQPMKDMHGHLLDVMSDAEFDEPHGEIDTNLHEDLANLFQTCLGITGPPSSHHILAADILQTVALNTLVRSLISAAVCEWVFQSNFSEISPAPCELLDEYRSLLATIGKKFYVSVNRRFRDVD